MAGTVITIQLSLLTSVHQRRGVTSVLFVPQTLSAPLSFPLCTTDANLTSLQTEGVAVTGASFPSPHSLPVS